MEKLRLDCFDNFRMRPSMREEPIASEPVDILTSVDIFDSRSSSFPLDSRMIPSERDRFSIFEPSFIEVFMKIME